jgi:tripartite-type tricarboxylate transporter receptor subunit TctC
MRRRSVLEACLVLAAFGAVSAPQARAADFFAGKTLNFLVGSDAGGGYDTYTRLLSRYIGKYIPGAPSNVVQDEPGAGGLRAAQQIYAVVPKDGLTIGNLRASNMLDSILKIRGADIDPSKYAWIGNMTSDTDLCTFWHAAGVSRFQDLQAKEVVVGASGSGSQGYSFPHAINSVLHTKMKIVPGYKGTGDRIVALQQGELQGNCGMNASTVTSLYPQMLADKQLIPIMQSGLRPYSALPDVPLTQSFAADESQKRILVTIFSQMDIARVFAAPPGTPADRVATLRTAFMAALRDPGLLADAKKQRLDINPISGQEVAKIVADMADVSDELRGQVRAALGE